ncbi:unnamed protein product [Hyaloperonospora brassicae]|uniref:WRKY19-like zinc finger domain-containing protein n=1 Tax=Hyaloperonospora brassicae TaxID=162125 RepID=A0AAV0T3H0_HYABA|nr:unnamed protein product [Hyaloperonospora brassicae]
MTIAQGPFAGLVRTSHPFTGPAAFSTTCRRQSRADYPSLAHFTASEYATSHELRYQQQQQQEQEKAAADHMMQQPATPTLHLSINPRLPSLAGLLKQMQATSPVTAMPSPQHSQLSPVSRGPMPIPSLYSSISPTMVKRVPSAASMPQTPLPGVGLFSLPSHLKMRSSMGLSSPGKKRSWADASYAGKAARTRASSCGSQPVHRNRASKYCKIEGCERVSQRNNLCHSHGGKRLCKEDGCSSKDRGNGFCIKHGGGKICSMAGCEKKARRKGLCTEHFRVSDEVFRIDGDVYSPRMAEQYAFRPV